MCNLMERRHREEKQLLSASQLREIVAEITSHSIEMHRNSREHQADSYQRPIGEPTDEEIDDFVLCNPLYDSETASQLTDPGLLGFSYPKARVSATALQEFQSQTREWASTNEWIGADLIPYHIYEQLEPAESTLWLPQQNLDKHWFKQSPNALLLAADLLKDGRSIAEMHWRDFEKLVGELLEREGWVVEVTRASRDGGIDIIASHKNPIIGDLRTIWQAKKYSERNKVRLSEIRELSGLVAKPDVTKGVIVTTSTLTRGALDWIRRDIYKLEYKEKNHVEEWIKRHL